MGFKITVEITKHPASYSKNYTLEEMKKLR